MILVIDNYDSFVFNLARYIEELNQEVLIVRNDKISIEQISNLNPTHLVLSPGPCGPLEAGLSIQIVKKFAKKLPILGICLGHQVIGHVFGGNIAKAKKPMHGKSSFILHNESGIFKNLPNPLKVGRYHSLIVEEENLDPNIIITSRSEEREIMSIAHKQLPLTGLQFHPESILTNHGHQIIQNFITSS